MTTCGPSQQQQLRHGHGDAQMRPPQYVYLEKVATSPSTLISHVKSVPQEKKANMHLAHPSSATPLYFPS